MQFDTDKALPDRKLFNVDTEISRLNDQQITLLFESLGLVNHADVPKNYLQWETILIIVPSRRIAHQLKQYRFQWQGSHLQPIPMQNRSIFLTGKIGKTLFKIYATAYQEFAENYFWRCQKFPGECIKTIPNKDNAANDK